MVDFFLCIQTVPTKATIIRTANMDTKATNQISCIILLPGYSYNGFWYSTLGSTFNSTILEKGPMPFRL